jgi:hypothetical protein
MSLLHEASDFDDLLRIVADRMRLSLGLVEKDYWVTHTLWSLHQAGFEVWFKGGTSLSKGFGLIERFSEDLDLKLEPGRVAELPGVSSWKSEGKKATAEREAYFKKLPDLVQVSGATVALAPGAHDKSWRSANLRVAYPGQHLGDLTGILKPFVVLEIGSARVTPFTERDMTSFVHAHLASEGQLAPFDDNRPRRVRCVHPLVTLLEKLDALHRRALNLQAEVPAFVRHFEDAARIVAAEATLPALTEHATARALAEEMLAQRQIAALPVSTDPVFQPDNSARWVSIGAAHAAIAPMFWGTRISIEDACQTIREWLARSIA